MDSGGLFSLADFLGVLQTLSITALVSSGSPVALSIGLWSLSCTFFRTQMYSARILIMITPM